MQATSPTEKESKNARILLELLRAISANKSTVKVKESRMASSITLSVFSGHKDYGRVIGSHAKNYRCFELFTKMMAARDDMEAQLSVIPPDNQTPSPEERFKPNPKWGKEQLLPLVRELCQAIFESGGVIDIVEPDPMTVNIEVKINNEDELFIIKDGQRLTKTLWPREDNPREMELVDIDSRLMQRAFRVLFHGVGKNNGRNVFTFVHGITYPNSTR